MTTAPATATAAPGGSWAECDRCEGTGLVVDNRREETTDCPNCAGMGMVYFAGPGDVEWEPEDEDGD